jgi:hypothetical protein
MFEREMTPEIAVTQSRNLRRLEILAILGILGGFALWILADPTSTKWGISQSPERMTLLLAYALLVALPIWIWSIYRFSTRQKWLAEDLAVPFEPNRLYPLWTKKRITNICLGIGLVGLSELLPVTPIYFPQFVATYLTVVYGPIEGGLSAGLGYLLIRGPLFNGITNPYQLIAYCLGEGMTYFVTGHFYREFLYHRPIQQRLTIGLVFYLLFANSFHAGFIVPGLFWGVAENYIGFGPLPASLARRVWQMAYWIPTTWLYTVVGAYLTATVLQDHRTYGSH